MHNQPQPRGVAISRPYLKHLIFKDLLSVLPRTCHPVEEDWRAYNGEIAFWRIFYRFFYQSYFSSDLLKYNFLVFNHGLFIYGNDTASSVHPTFKLSLDQRFSIHLEVCTTSKRKIIFVPLFDNDQKKKKIGLYRNLEG